MIGQQKRTLEHCVSFQPVKCIKQSEELRCKERCESKDEDEVVDAHVVEGELPHELCIEESLCALETSTDKETKDNSSSQEHSSVELCCPLHESSASSPAPTRYFHLQLKRVPVGTDHQADVPEWDPTMGHSNIEEEKQWYGDRIWLSSEVNKEQTAQVGKGRNETCFCLFPGSIECVRRHVEEERLRVMNELGTAFGLSGFNDMGECVSQHWSEAEERAFKELVKLNPASRGRNFWRHLSTAFPSRSPLELVSYYFNVFVLRRRALQNRIDPDNVDSDDDEGELPDSDEEDWDPIDEESVEGDEEEAQEEDEGGLVESDEEEIVDEEQEQYNFLGRDHEEQRHPQQSQVDDQHRDFPRRDFGESFFRANDSELEVMRLSKSLGSEPEACWLEWDKLHQSSFPSAGIGFGALELSSTNAMQELFGKEDASCVKDFCSGE